MYTDIFKSRAKQETSASRRGAFEGMNMVFATGFREVFRGQWVFFGRSVENKDPGEGVERSWLSERGWLNKEYKINRRKRRCSEEEREKSVEVEETRRIGEEDRRRGRRRVKSKG